MPIWTGNVANGYHIPLGSGKVDRHRTEGFLREQVVARMAVDLGRRDAVVPHDLGQKLDPAATKDNDLVVSSPSPGIRARGVSRQFGGRSVAGISCGTCGSPTVAGLVAQWPPEPPPAAPVLLFGE